MELGELRSKFVSTASHQFRTPLTVIQSNIELLDMILDNTNDEVRSRYSKISSRIQQEIKRMTDLMNNVLVLGKINSNAIAYNPQWLDLILLCQDLIDQHSTIQKDNRIIEYSFPDTPVMVMGDVTLLSNAIENLISNAFKYSVGAPNPQLYLISGENGIEIHVVDKGVGIPEEDFIGLFKPFFRSGNVKDIEGTGLGLSIVKEYLDMNNAEVSFSSVLNKGTTFKILFSDSQ